MTYGPNPADARLLLAFIGTAREKIANSDLEPMDELELLEALEAGSIRFRPDGDVLTLIVGDRDVVSIPWRRLDRSFRTEQERQREDRGYL